MTYYDITIPTGSNYEGVLSIIQSGIPMDLTPYTATMYFITGPGEFSPTVFTTVSGQIVNGGVAGTLTLELTPSEIATISGSFYKLEIDDGTVQTEVLTGNIFILDEAKSGVEYLIPILRMQLGDTNPLAYRYVDAWLKVALVTALKSMQRWWSDRYTISDVTYLVTRSLTYTFPSVEPPVILQRDQRPLILMASILVKSGQLENNSWNVGSWKDAEIALSNIEGNRGKQFSINLDWEELKMYIIPPTRRLVNPARIDAPEANLYVSG